MPEPDLRPRARRARTSADTNSTTARRAPDQAVLPGGLPVLATKLVPPPERPGIVGRRRLSATLTGLSTPIVAVVAPAGYGKSTAVAEWAADDERPVAWLSIDPRDNDPYLLLSYLHVAIDAATPLPADVRAAIAAGSRSIWTSAVPRLGAALAACPPLVVVLDDFDLVTDPDGADAILALAGHLSPGSQLLLIGRTAGRLPMPRLIAEGTISLVEADDLGFDLDETVAVLRATGTNLPPAEVERVTAHLEGWPAGVYLTARSIKAGDPVAVPTAPATHLASEYLRTELLDRLDADDLAFAVQTSVLERLSGPSCDAVTERDDSAARLRSWERSNLFLIPLDGDHIWYRYHHLLHEVLATDLSRRGAQAGRDLHARAATWHLGQGLHEQAFEHYAAAGLAIEAATLLPGLLQRTWNAGRAETALRWADWFEGTTEFHGQVGALVAGSLVFRHIGDATRADRWSDAADRWRPEPGDPTAARGEALRLMGRAFGMRSGSDQMLDDAKGAVAGMEPSDLWHTAALGLRGIAEQLSGLSAAADASLDDAIAEARARKTSPTVVALSSAFRALIAIARDDWTAAAAFVADGQQAVADNQLGEHSPGITIDAVAARVAVHRGDRAAAQALLAHSGRTRLVLNHALPWLAVRTRLDLASAHLGLADPAGARTLLLEIRDVMTRRPKLGILGGEVAALQARLEQIRGGSPSASTLTVAELRLLPLLSTHLSFREIGERLFISQNTVKSQAISIYRKLDATSRSEAIGRAADAGLIDATV